MMQPLADRLVERFLRYVAVPSQSDARATTVPSTPGQWDMVRLLEAELRAMGLSEIHLDANAVLTVRLPGTVPDAPRIGFCAHVDTVDIGLSPVIRPRRVRFEGDDICLDPSRAMWLRTAEHPEILPYDGQDVLVTDGSSVLGADNKAAVAVVMTLLEALIRDAPPHGDVVAAFVPDEEIGLRGARAMDLRHFPVDFAYTIDGCELGELVTETFNAAQATIVVQGVAAHPMSARNVLVNPILVAADLVNRFDPFDTPEHTAGRDGYCWINGLSSNQTTATLSVSIRDFDRACFENRKHLVREAVAATAAAHPRATLSCRIEDSYANIESCLGNDRRCVALLHDAFAAEGIAPKVIAMRGGTDGSALSARGIPTPNFFTGAHNFHSPFEFLPVPAFEASYRLAERLLALAAGPGRNLASSS